MLGQITGESIKSAISLRLRNKYAVSNDQTKTVTYPTIYKEKMVENMVKPCFFIWTMDVSQEKELRNNYTRAYQMNIRYHPVDKDGRCYENLCEKGNELLDYLSQISLPIIVGYDANDNAIVDDKPIYGTQMSFTITDDVLQVYVTYSIRAKQQLPKDIPMQTLKIEENEKEE